MKRSKLFLIILLVTFGIFSGKAQSFFDTSAAPRFFNLGVRAGFNTSNRTFGVGNFPNMIFTTWGIGFNAGAVANINFRNFFTMQPGFFFESRSGNLINIVDYYRGTLITPSSRQTHYEKNHLQAYYFTIPIMGVVKFNLARRIKWNVEFGPYFQICIKEKGENEVAIFYRLPQSLKYDYYYANQEKLDVGLKMGSSLQFYKHAYLGFHYLAGLTNAWSLPKGGKNRSWSFTLGYDF